MKSKLPRIPGFKYGPMVFDIHTLTMGTQYRVEQKGFWGDNCACGPYKPTEAEAIKAWKRLVRKATTIRSKE